MVFRHNDVVVGFIHGSANVVVDDNIAYSIWKFDSNTMTNDVTPFGGFAHLPNNWTSDCRVDDAELIKWTAPMRK